MGNTASSVPLVSAAIPHPWLSPEFNPQTHGTQLTVSFYDNANVIPVLFEQGRAPSLATTPLQTDRDAQTCHTLAFALAPLFRLNDASAAAAYKLVPSLHRQQGSVNITDIAAVSRKGYAPGYKEHNQDSCVVVQNYMHRDQSLFGVMDGHGLEGHHVSSFVSRKLPIVLFNNMLDGLATQQALEESFMQVDDLVASTTSVDTQNSGSTCVVGLLQGRTLTTAWVGDSRAILASRQPDGQWAVRELSTDHKPDTPNERARITGLGGRVERSRSSRGPVGPFRVWLRDEDTPGLAMSRAIGDHIARRIGVIARPDVRVTKLPAGESFLVIASDGVWEYMSNQEVAQLVGAELDRSRAAAKLRLGVLRAVSAGEEEHGANGGEAHGHVKKGAWSVGTVRASPALLACAQLVSEARMRWVAEYGGKYGYIDDITAVVVKLDASERAS